MRARKLMSELIHWRWAPCLALVGGALLYVGLVLAVVPSELGQPLKNPRESLTNYGLGERSALQFGRTLNTSSTEPSDERREVVSEPPVPQPTEPVDVNVRRGFS